MSLTIQQQKNLSRNLTLIYTFQVFRVLDHEMKEYQRKIQKMRDQKDFDLESEDWFEHMIHCHGCNLWSHPDMDVQTIVNAIIQEHQIEETPL